MTKTIIKFCGITSIDDYKFINDQEDIDFIGLIFTEKSPRCLKVKQAEKISQSCTKQKSIVGVFMDQSEKYIQNIISHIDLDIIQFHGKETVDFCRSFNKPFIKTFHVKDSVISIEHDFYEYADYFLYDSSVSGKQGGTGEMFNWDLLFEDQDKITSVQKKPYFAAGGLNINNIGNLISKFMPYGIDVSSGLESSIGKKDHLLMKKFLENVRISEKGCYEKN